uniref:Uncharacterized protein n=1 Tax=Glossina pallidipes TaxID=7398 RepID=A0A1A9Z3X3_GLOPL
MGICTLFHNTNPREKENGSKCLKEFQKSIYSWTIADELLQRKRDLHSYALRNKIQNSFNELPPSSHESIRDSLTTHIGQITIDNNNIIVTELCLALADLSLLMASYVITAAARSMWTLLEILTLIPEEMDSRYLRLGANRREAVHLQLEAAAPKVMEYLCMCMHVSETNQEKILNATLRCYSTWVAIHAILFKLLSMESTSRKLHDTATECMCALLSTSLDPQFKLQKFNCICMPEPAYHNSVGTEDIDKTMNYCRIFTVLCEADDMPHYSIDGLDLVLICVGHFDVI